MLEIARVNSLCESNSRDAMGKKREEPAVSTFNSNPESTCSPARNIEVAWTILLPRVGVFETEQSLPLSGTSDESPESGTSSRCRRSDPSQPTRGPRRDGNQSVVAWLSLELSQHAVNAAALQLPLVSRLVSEAY
jgi:hypothetical protein